MVFNDKNHLLPQQLIQSQNKPLIMAHRGNKAKRPENSLAAFQLALEENADIIETDLRMSKDMKIVCVHDKTIDRTTSGSGLVASMSLTELKRHPLRDDRSHDVQFIPTLEEVISQFSKRTFFALELKAPSFEVPHQVELLLSLLEEYECLERVILISFSRSSLELVEDIAPSVSVAHISLFSLWPSPKHQFVAALWPMFFLNPFFVHICHARGQICGPLDPTPEPRLRLYLKQRVDVLLTNDPGLTINRINELRKGR